MINVLQVELSVVLDFIGHFFEHFICLSTDIVKVEDKPDCFKVELRIELDRVAEQQVNRDESDEIDQTSPLPLVTYVLVFPQNRLRRVCFIK
jgi:hypothetical protein